MKGGIVAVLVLGIATALAGAVDHRAAGRPVVPAVFVFGDSTLDVGNNNYLPGKDVPRANVPFYGIDFPGGPKPTGRFSNGYNIADFIAKNLGFERSPLAYLALKSRNYLIPSALTRGVSYASAGAGILDSTNAGNNIPLSKQLRYFASTKAEMEAAWGTHKVSKLLANSFFLLGIGSNDMFHTMPKTAADVPAIYSILVSNYSAAIADLYGMGARKFGIINVGPVGCVPRLRVLNATGACNDALNLYAAGFAAAVNSAFAGLANKLPGFSYSLSDAFAATQISFASPRSSGMCCQIGTPPNILEKMGSRMWTAHVVGPGGWAPRPVIYAGETTCCAPTGTPMCTGTLSTLPSELPRSELRDCSTAQPSSLHQSVSNS